MAEAAYETEPAEPDGRSEDERIRQKLEVIVGRLQGMADDQVSKKSLLEERWLEDLRAYHGRYDTETEKRISTAKKSRLYVNLTRTKTHSWEARLSDMLFPTDDRNWGIRPTPVPEMIDTAQQAAHEAAGLTSQANLQERAGNPDQAKALAGKAQPYAQAALAAHIEMDEARRRAVAMEKEIEDQLREARYNIKSRVVIHDACKLGTGIMKGPMKAGKMRRAWEKIAGEGGGVSNLYRLIMRGDARQAWERVDPWNFFPDMTAATVDEMEFTFERHLLTPKDLRQIARTQPEFDRDAIRRLLDEKPQMGLPLYINHLRNITGSGQDLIEGRYQVWEFHGALEREDMRLLAECQDPGLAREIDIDPLDEYRVVAWFSQGHLLKWGVHPLDSGESLYSIFPFERDDTSVFGYGIPHLMRDSQKALNGAWRMIMDNAGLSVGPQVVVDQTIVEPANGSWEVTPRKVWLRVKTQAPGSGEAFQVFNIPNNQQQLVEIIALARQFIDDETNLPLIAHGEAASHITTTAQGMSMLMNSVNVVFRRVVRNFDDDMTTPNITRAYDWNMQFSSKDHIKGDYEVDARGSSVLLVREVQSQNLLVMASNFSGHPVLGRLIKVAALVRKLVQSWMLPASEIVKTDEEIKAEAQAEAQQQQMSPEEMSAQAAIQAHAIDAESKKELALIARETALITLAHTHNITLEELEAKLDIKGLEIRSKERIFAAEAAVEERQAQRELRADPADGPRKSGGSGGYIA